MFSVLVCYFMLIIWCFISKEKGGLLNMYLINQFFLVEKEGKNCYVNILLVKIWV